LRSNEEGNIIRGADMVVAIGKVNMPELTGVGGVLAARNLAVLSMSGSGLHSGFSTPEKGRSYGY